MPPPDAPRPLNRPIVAPQISTTTPPVKPGNPGKNEPMLCERCRAEMYRMHAVWRCPACGFKTDCCGW